MSLKKSIDSLGLFLERVFYTDKGERMTFHDDKGYLYPGSKRQDSGKWIKARGSGRGSRSMGGKNQSKFVPSKKETKFGGKLTKTSLPCGRAARRKGVGGDYGRRCHDGSIPSWAGKAKK
tara:strand:+ start:1360 stop:1719 length:360 start_codon:yes stop_codon:yes gene_type:complete